MVRKYLLALLTSTTLFTVAPSLADDADTQAKATAEQFAKALLADKNLDAVVKLVAVPTLWNFDEPTLVRDAADLQKRFAGVLADPKFIVAKGPTRMRRISTGEQFMAKLREGRPANAPLPFDNFLKKTDRVVELEVNADPQTTAILTILLAPRDGGFKVVGYDLAWARSVLPKK